MIKGELWKFETLREWKRLEMKWIDIVGVIFYQLHSHAFKPLKLFSISILMSTTSLVKP